MSERDFQSQVRDYALIHGWRYYSIPDSRRASMRGWPDAVIYCAQRGRILFIEFKADKGRVRPEQVEVLSELSHFGETHVWRPKDRDTAFGVLSRK